LQQVQAFLGNGIENNNARHGTSSLLIPTLCVGMHFWDAPRPFRSTAQTGLRPSDNNHDAERRANAVLRRAWDRENPEFKICLALRPKLLHERSKLLDSLAWHRVVDRGANAADATVTFEAVQSAVFAFLHEFLFELLARQAESDVHQRATIGLSVTAIKTARA